MMRVGVVHVPLFTDPVPMPDFCIFATQISVALHFLTRCVW